MAITATCHCNNVEITLPDLPVDLGCCNCSICRRYGALWGYYPPEAVSVNVGCQGLDTYQWGDREVDFQRCPGCGCITHYSTTDLCPETILAVNFRMVEPAQWKDVPIRDIDGASFPVKNPQ